MEPARKASLPSLSDREEAGAPQPDLYQCSSGECRFQFTATTHTPLHATKLPLSTWFKALWLILQSDKGLSSVRLAEALGVSQPTAWRLGHALRLMVARENPLGGTVEIDEFYLGGRPKSQVDTPSAVHTNSAEGFNSRVRRTIAGVFHHISPEHADLYFNEIGFRWSQRVVTGQATRRTRRGRETVKTLWSRVPPALQLPKVFHAATGRQMRRTRQGGLSIKSSVAVFG